jgi:hypothetical protein
MFKFQMLPLRVRTLRGPLALKAPLVPVGNAGQNDECGGHLSALHEVHLMPINLKD